MRQVACCGFYILPITVFDSYTYLHILIFTWFICNIILIFKDCCCFKNNYFLNSSWISLTLKENIIGKPGLIINISLKSPIRLEQPSWSILLPSLRKKRPLSCIHTYKHKLTFFSHGGRQKPQNATCFDPYIPTPFDASTFIHLVIQPRRLRVLLWEIDRLVAGQTTLLPWQLGPGWGWKITQYRPSSG